MVVPPTVSELREVVAQEVAVAVAINSLASQLMGVQAVLISRLDQTVAVAAVALEAMFIVEVVVAAKELLAAHKVDMEAKVAPAIPNFLEVAIQAALAAVTVAVRVVLEATMAVVLEVDGAALLKLAVVVLRLFSEYHNFLYNYQTNPPSWWVFLFSSLL
jgi:hypothetical protein